jgi:hypothetical protein
MTRNLLIITLACLLLLAGSLGSGHEINWYAITGGGGRATQGSYTLDYAIGQTVTGTSISGTTQICSGFLCGASSGGNLFLPVVRR